jgi:hypothetical protein
MPDHVSVAVALNSAIFLVYFVRVNFAIWTAVSIGFKTEFVHAEYLVHDGSMSFVRYSMSSRSFSQLAKNPGCAATIRMYDRFAVDGFTSAVNIAK